MRFVHRLAILLAMAATACGESDEITPLQVAVQRDRELILAVSCTHNVDAEVAETSDEVRIEHITRDGSGGDCLGLTHLRLEESLGSRALVVEGELWHRLDNDCAPSVQYGPSNDDVPPFCVTDPGMPIGLCSLDRDRPLP